MLIARILVYGAAFAAADAAPIYTITNLGTLGGTSSTAYAISNKGVTVGSATNAGEYERAFTAGDAMAQLTAGPVYTSSARGVNFNNAVIGTTYTLSGAQATLWNGGLFQNLGTLGGTESYGNALNDSGVAVGGAMTGDGQLHAFQYGSGTLIDLGTLPGGTWSAAYAVNNLGVIAGSSDAADRSFHAVRWDTTGIHPLGTLGGSNSYAFAINSAGQIAGSSTAASGYLHAFLYTMSGGMTDLGTLGGTSSYAYAINNGGEVVGYSFTARDSSSHATLWRDGTLLDLNSLVAPSGSWVLNEAYGINDFGQIVGAGTYNGQTRAFRLDPISTAFVASDLIATDLPAGIPEPATRYAVAICAGAMAYFAKRRG